MTTARPVRRVYDCNILFQAHISPAGPAAVCLRLAQRGEVMLFCAEPVVAEVRAVAARPVLRSRFQISDDRVDRLIDTIREAAIFVDQVPPLYLHPDDPDDSLYVNLALATGSTLLVSRDADLLRLMDVSRPVGREFVARYPTLRITDPVRFLAEVAP